MERSKIVAGPVWARLQGPPDIVAVVQDSLAVYDPASEHTQAYKSGRWDGRVPFVKRADNSFLAGLTWRVARTVLDAGFERPEIVWPAAPIEDSQRAAGLNGMEWRPYQLEAVGKWMRARRLLLQCPTRGGKTEIAIEGIRRIGGKTLWVTHLRELFRQTPERFLARLGVECGVADSNGTVRDGRVVVGMVQSLARLVETDPGWFEQFDVLVMDEAHHAGADTWQAVAKACTRATWRLGLSGTARTGHAVTDLKIEGAFGPVFEVATTMELAGLGFVARPRVCILHVPPATYPSYSEVRSAVCPDWRDDPRVLSAMGGALFRTAYKWGVMDNEARNRVIIETAVRHAAKGEKFLVLCNRVPHAEALQTAIALRTVRGCWQLDGGAPEDERRAAMDWFKRQADGCVLVCTPFFREGVDLPQIDAGILAGGGESDIAVLQALGRMLTVRPDKPEVLIYDLADGRDLVHPKDYLGQHFMTRLRLYEKHGFAIERS